MHLNRLCIRLSSVKSLQSAFASHSHSPTAQSCHNQTVTGAMVLPFTDMICNLSMNISQESVPWSWQLAKLITISTMHNHKPFHLPFLAEVDDCFLLLLDTPMHFKSLDKHLSFTATDKCEVLSAADCEVLL